MSERDATDPTDGPYVCETPCAHPSCAEAWAAYITDDTCLDNADPEAIEDEL